MRTLLLMRGAPGSGKTTYIKNNHLENYTLSPDNIRLLCSSISMNVNGEYKILQDPKNENKVWEILFNLLEYRMSRGEFTVIDATCSKTKDINQYKTLADKYKYRMYIVDFTDIPLSKCLERNKLRPSYKIVPDEAIKNIYARFATQQIPSGVKVLENRDTALDEILEKPIDLSNYNKLVFIGDIHGCYDTLTQYEDFKSVESLKDDVCYIFCGDYIDRGNQNYEVLTFLDQIKDKQNVCLLEGNHEKWIRCFGDREQAMSKEFENVTKHELYSKHYSEKQARMLYRKIRQMSHILYNGYEILACHGGIPTINNSNLLFVPTIDFISGVGDYRDYKDVTATWLKECNKNQFLIHGHRNTECDEIKIADNVFNLEGKVEFGGSLRIVELTKDLKWNCIELENNQKITETTSDENIEKYEINDNNIEAAISYLRTNKYINEKKLSDDISSFNFTREAFYKKNWNRQTILARGLFIDTKNNKIIARSYPKFFNIEENDYTTLDVLKNKLAYPISVYRKENGFLAIVSYDYNKDDLFIASKSTNSGPYVEYIKEAIKPFKDNLLSMFRNSDKSYSYVFECVDIQNDPHIINYPKNNIYLLDIIENTLNYKALSYEELKEKALEINCNVKQKVFTINNWDEFKEIYNKSQDVNYKLFGMCYIEGFVFVDSNNFMTKLKTGYYKQWKKLRSIAEQTLKTGYVLSTGSLTNYIENLFYGYCREIYKKYYDKETKSYPFKTDIISLRDNFLYEKKEFIDAFEKN